MFGYLGLPTNRLEVISMLKVLGFLVVLLALTTVSSAQELQKWTFDTEADIPTEDGFTWNKYGDQISIDTTVFVDGSGSVRIDCAGGGAENHCGLRFEYHDVEPLRGGAVVLSVDVKTEYEGKESPAYLWIRTDSEDGVRIDQVASRDRSVWETQDWSRMSVTLPIAQRAALITIEVASGGIGTAWFDNLTLTAIDWTMKDAILAEVSSRLAIWKGSWYDWLKVLMAYAALPLALLFAASQSKRKEKITGVPWALRFLGLGLVIMAVIFGTVIFNLLPFSLRMFMKAGRNADLALYASIFGLFFTFIWWRYRDRIDEIQLWRNIGLIIRYFLVGIFFIYAFAKFYRSQFMPIPEFQLDTRLGDLRPQRLLWFYFGHSYAYVLFVALSEATGALLLAFRRTYVLGAMVLFVVISNIVFVNYAYEIEVKFSAAIYLIMTIFLLLEEFPRIWGTLIAKSSELPPPVPYRASFKPRIGIALSVSLVLFLAWRADARFKRGVDYWETQSQMLPFSGVWIVEDGEPEDETAPDLSWDRLVVQSMGRGRVEVGTKNGDTYTRLAAVSYSDSLQTFSMIWKDSTDTFSGHYVVEGDTLRLRGIQYGDSLNLNLIKRKFRLEPDR